MQVKLNVVVAAAAFELEGNAVRGPLNSPRGPVFITVTDKKAPYVPELDEVKDRVREDVIRTRANLFQAESVLQEAALDKYSFIRDAWVQRRRNMVYDGSPPRPKEED